MNEGTQEESQPSHLQNSSVVTIFSAVCCSKIAARVRFVAAPPEKVRRSFTRHRSNHEDCIEPITWTNKCMPPPQSHPPLGEKKSLSVGVALKSVVSEGVPGAFSAGEISPNGCHCHLPLARVPSPLTTVLCCTVYIVVYVVIHYNTPIWQSNREHETSHNDFLFFICKKNWSQDRLRTDFTDLFHRSSHVPGS
jgi:hypothetical protein